jgi:hypothetical protein
MMRQSPKPCNQAQDEANPISYPVRRIMGTHFNPVQLKDTMVPNFQYDLRQIFVVLGVL